MWSRAVSRVSGVLWRQRGAAGTAGLAGMVAGCAFNTAAPAAQADNSHDYTAAMAVLDDHFGGRSASPTATTMTGDNPWSRSSPQRPVGLRGAASTDGKRVLRIAFLQCEELRDFLSPALFDTYGGYYKMNCNVFDYVTSLTPQALASHGVPDPLPQGVKVDFEVFNCQAGQFPQMHELDNYDGFFITGSLAGVYDDEPWIKQLDRWTAQAHAAGAKIVGISCAPAFCRPSSLPAIHHRFASPPPSLCCRGRA